MSDWLTGGVQSGCLPKTVGYQARTPTLCLGLDIAWYGGSKSNPRSQYDFIVSTLADSSESGWGLRCQRVKLINRDEDAEQTAAAIGQLLDKYSKDGLRVVLALDAPLQSTQQAPPPPRQKSFRACERYFSSGRQSIDRAAGGSDGWHPNVQPGVPLAPRVQKLLRRLETEHQFQLWRPGKSESDWLIVECFPAEAIWSAKRLGAYPADQTSTLIKAYKKQGSNLMDEPQVRQIVNTVLLDAFADSSGAPVQWRSLVAQLISWMLQDPTWMQNGQYRGGKLLDDVVDSGLCLATALSYSHGCAHLWQDPDHPDDGHIAGPGVFAI